VGTIQLKGKFSSFIQIHLLQFSEIAWSSVTVSQGAGPVDMIIGRYNPEWMPVPVQEEPYELFTLMWTSLSPRYILQENEGTRWRL
jgi:hypothetical protein